MERETLGVSTSHSTVESCGGTTGLFPLYRCYYQHLGELLSPAPLLPLLSDSCCLNTSHCLLPHSITALAAGSTLPRSSHSAPSNLEHYDMLMSITTFVSQFLFYLGRSWQVHFEWLTTRRSIYYHNYYFAFYFMQCIMWICKGAPII